MMNIMKQKNLLILLLFNVFLKKVLQCFYCINMNFILLMTAKQHQQKQTNKQAKN